MSIWKTINKINDNVAVKLTLMMSTMWCVWLFFVWSLIPLAASSLESVCMYVSSTVIQLVALPLIMVGQNLLGRAAEERAAQDHVALMSAVSSLKHIMTEEDDETSAIADIKARLERIETKLTSPQSA